jgi:uncharacterized metal-binding protein
MDGKTHAATSAVLAGPTGLAVGALTRDPLAGALAAAGCIIGIPVSPDLDQDGMTISEGVVYGHFGALPGLIWRAYWMPYALAMPHRHVLSHGPFVGTLLRILYLAIVPLILDVDGTVPVLLDLWPLWLGLAISDLAHWAMDYLV